MRQNKLILRDFQQHFILISFLTVITAIILLMSLILGALWLFDPAMLGDTTLEELFYVAGLGFVLLALTYYYTIRIEHRVSGPVFVLMRNLECLGEGDLTTEMKLRQQDHLQGIAESLNRNMSSMRQKMRGIKNTANMIEQTNESDAIQSLLKQLQRELDAFKTE